MEKWLVLIAVVLVLCIAEWIREIKTFKITHYHITSEKLSGLTKEQTVLFLTDLHSNRYGKNNGRLLEAVKRQHPDIILIGGDMLVGLKGASTKVAEDFVSELAKICPVYYTNGNHEFRMKIYPETYGTTFLSYKESLQQKGVHFLENEWADLLWGDVPIRICGLEIPAKAYKKIGKTSFTLGEMNACLGENDGFSYQILLAHNPMYMDTYLKWGADLILSGHLHGGVVRIPGGRGVISPQFRLFPKYSGELRKERDTTVVVSKGLGVHTIPIRFMNPAELVVLHIGENK